MFILYLKIKINRISASSLYMYMMKSIGDFFLDNFFVQITMIQGYTDSIRLRINKCKSETLQELWVLWGKYWSRKISFLRKQTNNVKIDSPTITVCKHPKSKNPRNYPKRCMDSMVGRTLLSEYVSNIHSLL